MRISALLPVRDGAAHIADALNSILAQTLPPDEIVIVDGGSRDATCRIASTYPRVRIVAQRSEGLAAARNQALEEARGEWIAFIAHDDLWTPDKTALQWARGGGAPGAGLILGQTEEFRSEAPAPSAPRLLRILEAALIHRDIFARVGPFEAGLRIGCDIDWFVRAADAGVATTTIDAVVLRKRRHSGNLSAKAEANRADAFSVIARRQARRRNGG